MNPNNPEGYRQFKTDYAEMTDLANKKKLSHRIFYEAPSTGTHKEWFDAVKQGNIEKVKAMLHQGQNIEAKDSGSLGQTALGWRRFYRRRSAGRLPDRPKSRFMGNGQSRRV